MFKGRIDFDKTPENIIKYIDTLGVKYHIYKKGDTKEYDYLDDNSFCITIENPYKRIGYISILLVIGLMIFKGRYSGLGTNLIDLSFYGNVTYYDWCLKLIFTVVTLAIGFQGGEVTPLFSIGATLGFILAPIFHLPIELCVALGYTGVFASATNTLLAPMMIGLEVFGGHQMIAFIIICIFAYLVNGNKSIYTAQIKNF